MGSNGQIVNGEDMTKVISLKWLVHSTAGAGPGVKVSCWDYALAYCAERMDPEPTRLAPTAALHQAKRGRAFENSSFIGLARDGASAGEPCLTHDSSPLHSGAFCFAELAKRLCVRDAS